MKRKKKVETQLKREQRKQTKIKWVEAPYPFWVSNSNLCQKKRTVDCRTWKVKRNRFGFSEGWRVLMSEDWDWDLHWMESCQKKVETDSVILWSRTGLTAAWSQQQDVGRDRGGGGWRANNRLEVWSWIWGQRKNKINQPCWSINSTLYRQMENIY